MHLTWRPERLVPIADALDGALQQMEAWLEDDVPVFGGDAPQVPTGVAPLDRVCRGGLKRGVLTLLDCALESQGRAVLCSVARKASSPTLLAVEDVTNTTGWLLSGSAGVPVGLWRSGHLSEDDWRAVASHIGVLAGRILHLAAVSSVSGLRYLIEQAQPEVVVVEGAERFDTVDRDAILRLAGLASMTGVAMVTSVTRPLGHEDRSSRNLVHVVVAPTVLGSRATFVSADSDAGLLSAQASVNLLVGDVS